MKQYIERIGKFYSHIILENVGLFIAYGILSLIFTEGGQLFSSGLKQLLEFVYFAVIPLMISYTAGRRIGGTVGGLIAALAGVGYFSTNDGAHMLGALLTAPIAGWIAKRGLRWIKQHTAIGFEMLFQNLFIGVVGSILLLFTYYCFNPVLDCLQSGLNWLLDQLFFYNLIPFMSFLIEPGKVMFLNNAINHGLLVPLGLEQVQQTGSSMLFLMETNPGPGFGILLAYFLVGTEKKKNLLVNMGIELFGGIHELYFPYVLSNSILFLAVIAGGMAGNICFLLFSSGLIATPSPGSIFTILLLSPVQNLVGNCIGIIVSAAVSCAIAVLILKSRQRQQLCFDVQEKKDQKQPIQLETEHKSIVVQKNEKNELEEGKKEHSKMDGVKNVYFVCQGGFGSSAMGAAILRRRLKNEGLYGIQVGNTAIDDIPEDADVIFCQKQIEPKMQKVVTKAEIYYLENLSQSVEYDSWISSLKESL